MIRFARLFKSFIYAFRGLLKTFREEQNLRIQAAAAAAVVFLGLYFKISSLQWSILIIAITLVILMEIANSAVERVTDVLKPRIDGYVKEIKDIMAAAVMLSSFAAVIIGLIILGPPLIELIIKICYNNL